MQKRESRFCVNGSCNKKIRLTKVSKLMFLQLLSLYKKQRLIISGLINEFICDLNAL